MTNSVTIHPAPDHPGGGYAVIRVSDPIGLSANARISVFDLFRERFLGEHDWQPDPFEFGPYYTKAEGDTVEFSIGPEIVNRVSEFTSVRVEVGGHPTTLTWPENILQNPTAVSYSTIYSEEDTGKILEKETVRPPALEPSHVEDPIDTLPFESAPQPSSKPDPKEPKRLISSYIFLIIAIIAGFVIWWFALRDTSDITRDDVVATIDCSLEGALASDTGPVAALGSLADASDAGDCDLVIDASFALRLIEQAAVNGDGIALATLGDIYSSYTINPLVEERLGVALSEDPVIAFDYYRRAQEAGSPNLEAQLAAICEGTDESGDMMIQVEREDLCP